MKQRRELALLTALLVIGAGLFISNRRVKSPAPSSPKTLAFESSFGNLADAGSIHLGEIDKARAATYRDSHPPVGGRNSHPVKTGSGADPVQRVTEEAPKPPFAFFGYGNVPVGAPRRAFLTDGSEVFVVAEGQTLVGRFRVLCIDDVAVEIEDLSTGRHSTLPFDAELAARSRNSA
jgi:hypothetical protein